MDENQKRDETVLDNDLVETKILDIDKPNLSVWSSDVEITQTKTIKRLTFRSLLVDIADAFNLDKGLLYTIKGMTLRPAQTIQEYLDDKRYVVMNPIKFFILIIGTTLLIASQTGYFDDISSIKDGFEYGYTQGDETKEIPEEMKELEDKLMYYFENYFIKYQNIWFLITIVFTSFFTYLFFRKRGFNFIEHNIINAYIFIYTYLFFTMMVIFNLNAQIWTYPYMIIYTVMAMIVYKQIFMVSWWQSIYKTLLSFISSLLVFYLLFAILGVIWAIQSLKG